MKRMLVKTVLTLVGLALVAAAPAFASTIDFGTTSGVTGTWNWPGFGPLSLSISDISVDGTSLGVSSTESLTTGTFLGGAGTLTDPFMWGLGGSYTIDGCIPPAHAGCSVVNVFSGSFDDIAELYQGSKKNLVIFDLDVEGTLNSSLAAAIGVPSGAYGGVVSFNLTPTKNAVESGDLTLTSSPVPEPASLVFLGLGLVGVGAVTRLKKHQTQA